MGVTKVYSTTTIDSKDVADEFPFRCLYANHLPVRSWTVWYGKTLEEVGHEARRQAQQDLEPGSGVTVNVFIAQQWNEGGDGWVGDSDDGIDLTDLMFGEEEL